MNAKEFQSYWQELAKGAGLSADETKRVTEVLGDEKISATLAEKLMPIADHHRTLDKTKGEFNTQLKTEQAKSEEYQKWYKEQAVPAVKHAQTAVQTLQKYQEMYGPLDEKKSEPNGKLPENVVTRDDLDRYLAETTARQNQQWSNLWEKGLEFSAEYSEITGKRFPAAEFRKFAEERPGQALDASFKEFIAPQLAEKEKADREAWKTSTREEIERDVQSRLGVPPDTKPSEPHPFFTPSDEKLKDLDPAAAKSHSRGEFVTAWGEAGQA